MNDPVTLPPDLSALDGPPPYDLDGELHDDLPALDSWEQAEWALRQIAVARADVALTARRYEAQVAKLDQWRDDATRGPASRIAFLTEKVERWALAMRERTGRATYRFPAGFIATRQRKEPQVAIADEKAVLAWLHDSWTPEEVQAHGIISTTEKVRVSALREHLDIDGVTVVDPETGEAVPGVYVEPPSTTATLTLTDVQPQED